MHRDVTNTRPEADERPDARSYRLDVQGLRAIAVLAVLLFHLHQPLMPGGFVGVDIFFTISGFLITQRIWRDLSQQRFSFADFYQRRVARIVPAVLLVTLVTVITAHALMLPEDARAVAQSGLWSLVSMANVYFWRWQDTSYFAASSEELPLLHLWSLGVEEQFYLLWPVGLTLLFKLRQMISPGWLLLAAATASFALAELLIDEQRMFAYYMLPTRSGELLLGALVAIAPLSGRHWQERVGPYVAWVGIPLVCAPLFLLSESSRFPGWLAAVPTVGTALLLARSDQATSVTRALSVRPLVWMGTVSYSAYLWHWPILALYRYGHPEHQLAFQLGAFAATWLLAWLTYTLVENPIRRLRPASPIRFIGTHYVVPALAMGIFVLCLIYPNRVGLTLASEQYLSQLEQTRQHLLPADRFGRVCQNARIKPAELFQDSCVVGASLAEEPSIVLWGDSNAAQFVGMLEVFGEASGFRFRNIAISSCPPIIGDPAPFVEARGAASCRESLHVVRPTIDEYATVMIAASWSTYQARSPEFLPRLFETIRQLVQSEHRVVVIGKIAEMPGYDRRCQEKSLRYPWMSCPNLIVEPQREIIAINEALRRFSESNDDIDYFDVVTDLCPARRCSVFDSQGRPRYYDESHLTMEGSVQLGRQIMSERGVPEPFASFGESSEVARRSRTVARTRVPAPDSVE